MSGRATATIIGIAAWLCFTACVAAMIVAWHTREIGWVLIMCGLFVAGILLTWRNSVLRRRM